MNFQSGKTRVFWIENIVVLMRDNNRGDFEQECFPGSQPLTTQYLAGIGWGLRTPLFGEFTHGEFLHGQIIWNADWNRYQA